jgi:hypothetical protein
MVSVIVIDLIGIKNALEYSYPPFGSQHTVYQPGIKKHLYALGDDIIVQRPDCRLRRWMNSPPVAARHRRSIGRFPDAFQRLHG